MGALVDNGMTRIKKHATPSASGLLILQLAAPVIRSCFDSCSRSDSHVDRGEWSVGAEGRGWKGAGDGKKDPRTRAQAPAAKRRRRERARS